jgi:cytoskeleton protein RodZ
LEAPIETQTPVGSVGSYLRELRAKRGTSIEELGRVTRVASRYLEALEADAHDSLPAPVFTRGFIRAYCQAVGQSPDEVLALYDAREVSPMPRLPVEPMPTRRQSEKAMRSRSAVMVSAALVLVLGGALFAVALVIQPRDRGERVAAPSRPESKPEPSAVATASAPTAPAPPPATSPTPATVAGPPPPPTGPPTPKPSPAPVMVTPKVAAAPVGSVQVVPPAESSAAAPAAPTVQTVAPPNLDGLAGVSSPYRLVARTSEATWIRVRTDDGRNTEESIPAGEIREYVSNRPFILTVGNAAGVSLELNGRPVPQLGARGAVIPRLVLPPEAR